MTLAALTYPLSDTEAARILSGRLGVNYAGPTDPDTLAFELSVDAVVGADSQVHARPWATARRLIIDNTEYEVSSGLDPRLDRKLRELAAQQGAADATAGITDLVAALNGEQTGTAWSGSVETKAVW